ncbi:UNVERIFIED_CONTAM: hypothetical protein FKN15_032720 [Acipenser sinensis]
MTVGKDVSSLFPDVVNCMQTDNLELKKLVYLYLMNYAKSQPDMAIMAVNSFVKDCEDPNPLIRALAVRTMGCIRVDKITEYLCEPLRKCLKDEDPYVRKTAAVCVAKLHDINAQMVEDQGFLDSLRDLIADSNPMVVANAVAALSEISESHPNSNLLDLNPQNINKLLTALNECTEWGQIFILDCLSNYSPKDEREAQSICERVTPRLSHANSAVVLSAVKVLMKFLELLPKDSDYYNTLLKKLSPPLVTLLSGEPEVQYVALRNINLIVQKRPEILKQEIKVFFVKYNDPIYVKLEKLDIMIRLASQANIAQVLAELKEYATEVDVDFVRKAVRAIGRCAIKVEQSAERCVSTLLDLIQTKVNYVVQEAIVVIRDIFRKYPNKYESIIATLCENLDSLDEPDARAAMIWIVGEYAERIDNADELLESFLEGFHDESTQVQLTLLTAIVKLFLKKPSETQELVQQVLSLATQVTQPSLNTEARCLLCNGLCTSTLMSSTVDRQLTTETCVLSCLYWLQDSDNPDLRDRGYIYWRLLSTDPVTAKEVVLSEKPLISEETDLIEPTLLDELICHIGSLASVYHNPPTAFVEGSHGVHRKHLPIQQGSIEAGESPVGPSPAVPPDQTQVIPSQGDLLGDLLNLDLGPPVNVPQVSSMQMGAVDLLGGGLDSLQSAERCVSTLLDLIQTKVNYVVQEAIVVIRDIFRKYPNKYESIIATLCENLDSLDEPDARAAMIWIVGEYAERIDNADELLESFLEGFHDESTQVQLTLLTAIVKLFLKKPSETQELVQQVLSLATQDSDNPDLRDRGYIYWRLLSTDPVTAKEVVLSEKPLISEETDLIEPTLLDELICHIGSLASVYHKPPTAFVEGSHGVHRKHLPIQQGSIEAGESPVGPSPAVPPDQTQVIPSQGDLLGDLLNLDLGPPVNVPQVSSMQMGAVDLLGGGLDSLLGGDLGGGVGGSPAVGQNFIPSSVPTTFAPSPTPAVISSGLNDLFELSTGMGIAPGGHVAPKAVSPSRDRAGNETCLSCASIHHSIDVSLPLNTIGPVMKMDPLNNLQVAVKNSIDVFYFSCLIPLSIFFVEDGKMERQVFLATWKDIPNENELQYQIKECHLNADTVSGKLQNNNIYTIAKRNVEGQDMLYQSLKLTNGIWILAELRIQPGNPNYTVITSSAPSLPAPQSSGAAPLLRVRHRLHQPIVSVEVRASAV